MGWFRLAEYFVSINAEGQHVGELALFLRFTGCNLRCSYCDTVWAIEKDAPYSLCSTETLLGIAEESGVQNITLTGGEPLLQPDIGELMEALCERGYRVEVETNGAVGLRPFLPTKASFTMDYKLPSSNMEAYMKTDNFALLRDFDTVKFVCGSQDDLRCARQVTAQYQPPCPVYLSPVYGRIEPADMVEFMKENRMTNVRLQLQLHKFIWHPDARGV